MHPHIALLAVGAVELGWAAGGIVLGVIAALGVSRAIGMASISQAKADARRIRDQAESDARTDAEKARLEAERGLLERKEKTEKEFEQARGEIRENERRLAKREDLFDRKEEMLTLKEQSLSKQAESFRQREERISGRETETQRILEEQKDKLYKIADLTQTAAKELLLERVESESRQEVAKVVRKIIEDAEHDAKAKAREITLMAVQRYAERTHQRVDRPHGRDPFGRHEGPHHRPRRSEHPRDREGHGRRHHRRRHPRRHRRLMLRQDPPGRRG
jgi:vacuolar-type H+-ATPase subunit I/STV1